ncbi:uncharacterized protein [Lolium perenne]|uniref:uncharacterized protein n=1 Tax=Lolium perenne TaxID=4522 RepID=UPI0021F5EBE9|nr:uncharacterized protein LOC127327253 [Lolium perenne]
MSMTLDSLAKLIAEGERRATEMQELYSALSTIKPELESIKGSVNTFQPELEEIKSTLEAWKPAMEAKVADLGTAVRDLRRQVDSIAKGVGVGALGSPPTGTSPLTVLPPSVSSSSGAHSGQSGHGVELQNRGAAVESLDTLPPTLVTGPKQSLSMVPFTANTITVPELEAPKHPISGTNPPPQAEFPKFDGENPRLWSCACEKYFRVYAVSTEYWVEYATMHFTGNAALWFQSAEDKMGTISWQSLCDTINKRFDRGQYEHIYRLSFHIKQHTTVSEYIERFDTLMHHMLAYKPDLDPTFFTTRFIDGLRNDLRATVLIQCPQDLDTAVSLALLQEEIGEDVDIVQYSPKPSGFQRVNYKAQSPKSIEVSRDRTKTVVQAEDRRGTDAARATSTTQKLAALKAYRRAMNLCFKCGKKFSQHHQCAKTAQLHIVEELLEMIEGPDSPDSYTTAVDDVADAAQELLCLSQQAVSGTENNACFRLQGVIQGREILILIDSGSSGNFISELLAKHLEGVQPLPVPVKVKVANGGIISGSHYIPECLWSCQGAQFNTSVKVLPIQCYDLILGIEWLKTQSPMHVDWEAKWMEVKQPAGKHQIFGISADTSSCHAISADLLAQWDENEALLYLVQLCLVDEQEHGIVPEALSQLIAEFAKLFEEPTGLPPQRSCDHKIPLLPGATPMKQRPYRIFGASMQ